MNLKNVNFKTVKKKILKKVLKIKNILMNNDRLQKPVEKKQTITRVGFEWDPGRGKKDSSGKTGEIPIRFLVFIAALIIL